MREDVFISKDPLVSGYAPRLCSDDWAEYEGIIRSLHRQGYTKKRILTQLDQHGFKPSYGRKIFRLNGSADPVIACRSLSLKCDVGT